MNLGLNDLSTKQRLIVPVGALVLAFPVLTTTPLFARYSYLIYPLTKIFIFGIAVLSYNLLFRYTGLLSFGHALFFGGAGYVIGVLARNMDFGYFAAVPVSLVSIVLVSLVVGAVVVRLRGVYFAMITLAIAMIGHEAVLYFNDYTAGVNGIGGLNIPDFFSDPIHVYYLSFVVLVVCYVLLRRVVATPFGRVIQAIRENEERVEMLGINTYHFKLLSFAISASFAAIAGILYPIHLQFIGPSIVDWTTTGDILIMTLLGGYTVFWGPIIGVLTFVGLETQLSVVTDRWRLVLGVIFVLIVLYVPTGLVGLVGRVRGWLGGPEQASTEDASGSRGS